MKKVGCSQFLKGVLALLRALCNRVRSSFLELLRWALAHFRRGTRAAVPCGLNFHVPRDDNEFLWHRDMHKNGQKFKSTGKLHAIRGNTAMRNVLQYLSKNSADLQVEEVSVGHSPTSDPVLLDLARILDSSLKHFIYRGWYLRARGPRGQQTCFSFSRVPVLQVKSALRRRALHPQNHPLGKPARKG